MCYTVFTSPVLQEQVLFVIPAFFIYSPVSSVRAKF